MKTTNANETSCPVCSHKIDAHTDPTTDAVPSEGDWSICYYCRSLLVFTETLDLREPEERELMDADLLNISRVQKLLQLSDTHDSKTP